jgi:hypothetical protein
MKRQRTWVDRLVITIVVLLVIFGVIATVGAIALAVALNNMGSNK